METVTGETAIPLTATADVAARVNAGIARTAATPTINAYFLIILYKTNYGAKSNTPKRLPAGMSLRLNFLPLFCFEHKPLRLETLLRLMVVRNLLFYT